MDLQHILSSCDHTMLSQVSTWDDIKALCDDALTYKTASVCIPPCYVKKAKEYLGDRLAVCTVIGFPNGNTTTACKEFETKEALSNGADEIDMVINVGALKAKDYDYVLNEIKSLKAICKEKILKVIIETCFLEKEEIIKMCELVTSSGADYIKTSTGFGGAGATKENVRLMKDSVGPNVKVKAAGGISSLEDAEDFLKLGADRLGTSRVVKIVKAKND